MISFKLAFCNPNTFPQYETIVSSYIEFNLVSNSSTVASLLTKTTAFSGAFSIVTIIFAITACNCLIFSINLGTILNTSPTIP